MFTTSDIKIGFGQKPGSPDVKFGSFSAEDEIEMKLFNDCVQVPWETNELTLNNFFFTEEELEVPNGNAEDAAEVAVVDEPVPEVVATFGNTSEESEPEVKPVTPIKTPALTPEKKSPKPAVTAVSVNKPKPAPVVQVPTEPIQTFPKPVAVNGQPKPSQSWNNLFKDKKSPAAKPAAPVAVKPAEVAAVPQTNGWKTVAPKVNGKSHHGMENGDVKKNGNVAAKDAEDLMATHLADRLNNINPVYKPQALIPRGIYNNNSNCFINSIVQALIACPPFLNFLKALPRYSADERPHSKTPILDVFVRLASEFKKLPYQDNSQRKEGEICQGKNLDINFLYDMLVETAPHKFKKGRQEDAVELLDYVENGIHEELVKITQQKPDKNNAATKMEEDENAEGDWEKVTKKSKGIPTRKDEHPQSPISDIFQGMISTCIMGNSKSHAILEPFFNFSLPITDCSTIKQAIDKYTSQEVVESHKRQRRLIDVLPPVFILQMNRFIYKNNKNVKINDEVKYKTELVIEKEHLTKRAVDRYDYRRRSYKLFAVLHHHGNMSSNGHYSTDVFHIGLKCWLRYDDEKVTELSRDQDVLKHDKNRTPYILFYRRTDLG